MTMNRSTVQYSTCTVIQACFFVKVVEAKIVFILQLSHNTVPTKLPADVTFKCPNQGTIHFLTEALFKMFLNHDK